MPKRTAFPIDPAYLSLIFIGLMFMLPAVNMLHKIPITSFYSEWIAGALGLAALTPLLIKTSWSNIHVPQISFVFLGLAAILSIQWGSGILHSTQYALLVLSYLSWAFLLTLLGSHLRRLLGWDKLANTLAFFLVTAGIIDGSMMVLQIVTRTGGYIPFLPDLTSIGPFSQANHFADFTALATASLIYLYAKGRFSTAFFTLILIWFLLMLTVSGSRSSWLYLTTLTAFALLLRSNSIKQNTNPVATRTLLYACLVTLPLLALVHLFTHHIAPDGLFTITTDRIVNGINFDTPSARMQIWHDSFRLFWQTPWLGIGFGNINSASFLLLDTPTSKSFNSIFEHSHNLFLHLLTEMGIGAFLIVLICLFNWVRHFQWRELNPETWWLIGLLGILGIHSMLEYPLWYAYFLGIAAFLLGSGDEKIISINTAVLSKKHSSRLIRGGLVIILLLGALNLGSMLMANNKLTTAIYQSSQKDEKTFRQDLNWIYRYTLLSPYAELLYAVTSVIDKNDIDRQIAQNQSAISFKPFSKICYHQAILLKLKGDDINAKKLLKRTLVVYPGNEKHFVKSIPAEYQKIFLEILNQVNPSLSKEIALEINHSSN